MKVLAFPLALRIYDSDSKIHNGTFGGTFILTFGLWCKGNSSLIPLTLDRLSNVGSACMAIVR